MKPLVILSGNPVRTDLEAAPVGMYDFIRDDLRRISTVQPIDRVFIERTEIGYRGVLYSQERPFMFALNGNGFIAKPMVEDTAVMSYCATLEEGEQRLTGNIDANRADDEQEEFNAEFANGSPDEPSLTAMPEDAPEETTVQRGAGQPDFIERVPGTMLPMRQGKPMSTRDKTNDGVCGGAVVTNAEGKVLLVKPTNGYGG
jgi:hypothetical protein